MKNRIIIPEHILKRKIPKYILENASDVNVDEYVKVITENIDTFVENVYFLDLLDRDGEIFNIYSQIHLQIHLDIIKYPKYNSFYIKVLEGFENNKELSQDITKIYKEVKTNHGDMVELVYTSVSNTDSVMECGFDSLYRHQQPNERVTK